MKIGTVANVTTRSNPSRRRAMLITTAVTGNTLYWVFADGTRIRYDPEYVAMVEPLTVLDMGKFDLAEMLKDLTVVRDKLKFTQNRAWAWRGDKTDVSDMWGTVCDLVEAFAGITKEAEPEKTRVPEPGVGGIVEINGNAYSRGVDNVWRDADGVPLGWEELVNFGYSIDVLSDGIQML